MTKIRTSSVFGRMGCIRILALYWSQIQTAIYPRITPYSRVFNYIVLTILPQNNFFLDLKWSRLASLAFGQVGLGLKFGFQTVIMQPQVRN